MTTRHDDDDLDPLMTRDEVALYLRMSLSSVDRLRRTGALGPVAHVGHRGVRFHRAHVRRYALGGDESGPRAG